MKLIRIVFIICSLVFLSNTFVLANESNPRKRLDHHNFDSRKFLLKDKNITGVASRFSIVKVSKLKSISIMLGGDNENGHCRLRVFGREGGRNAPLYEQDLIEPIWVNKSIKGLEAIDISIEKPLVLEENQFFICLDSFSNNTYIVSSKNEQKSRCNSPV